MRKNLRASGLEPPSEFTTRLIGSVEQQELLEELWVHLGTDDEGETPYGGDVEVIPEKNKKEDAGGE